MKTTFSKIPRLRTDAERIAALQAAHRKVAALEIAHGDATRDAAETLCRVNEIRDELAAAKRELAALVDACMVAAA